MFRGRCSQHQTKLTVNLPRVHVLEVMILLACEQARLVCYSREYLGGGSRRVKPREEWGALSEPACRL